MAKSVGSDTLAATHPRSGAGLSADVDRRGDNLDGSYNRWLRSNCLGADRDGKKQKRQGGAGKV
jgi:hypothetical protein